MKAVVYILGNRKHRNNYWDIPNGEVEAPLMNDVQVKVMARSGLVEFGSHAMDHVRLTDLSPAKARQQIVQSRKVLQDITGKPVLSLAYPYGIHNEDVKRMTREAGYSFGISVGGRFTRFGEDLFEIRRVHMFPHSSVFDLWKKTTGFYHRYRKLMGKFNVS
jgi:peptidoglycan/xylan/chitin deacetylase (PgdA/CDA1 family)